ncbi:PadR family transcriptional regulator [Salinibacterium hongtaonis]|uniref:PadR family transcriptional regulator n=1 Tax=Homoserinimonas hongtaonis TaxID=2079791 RepID=A0A2U1SZC7_9MICO|nr:helix-turn-helix transcriptional regulator [Salinibacterium hongtaonis]PWB96984.1 PadR family transcriptional regulator [Salinibacterium hongtaonis]
MNDDSEWPTDWLRAVLSPAVLRVLADGPTYGYAISARLEAAGFGKVKGGTLYPLLGRLEVADLVRTEWRAGEAGPGRKYYELTPGGKASLAEQAERWTRFVTVTELHLQPTTEEQHD